MFGSVWVDVCVFEAVWDVCVSLYDCVWLCECVYGCLRVYNGL